MGCSRWTGGASPPPDEGSIVPAVEFSDDALAQQFSNRHVGQLAFVPAWGKWLRWNGAKWGEDDTLAVYDLVRDVCREAAGRAMRLEGGTNLARKISSAVTVSAAERLARSDPRHARAVGEFDADPWTLNTPGGAVDLRTGSVRPHRPGDLFTKVTTATPGGDCPRWLTFLSQACGGDQELVDCLQRWAGYALTGDMREHAFLFIVGPGGNGKSLFINTLAAALGDYAVSAMPDVLQLSRSDQHPTHLAALRGARMVTVPEVEEGRPWAEQRIKALTGGDRITARVMRGDPFDFNPTGKIFVAGNHRPVLRNPDQAMRRRLHLVPFTHVPAVPDMGLADALRVEAPGILAWAIQGCQAWRSKGLQAPRVVVAAVDEYFADQDALSRWIDERCERDPTYRTGTRDLFLDWGIWARASGDDPGTEKRFSEAFERSFCKYRSGRSRGFVGVRLRPDLEAL